jgi:heme/copper-type cytochrome/quinol oxidase subunit 2
LSSAADIPTAPAIVPVGNRVNADAVTAQSAASASARTFLLVLLFLVFVLVLVLVVATILLGVRVRGVTRKKSTSHDATQEPAERTTSRAATCSSCEIIESPAIHANLRKMMQKN